MKIFTLKDIIGLKNIWVFKKWDIIYIFNVIGREYIVGLKR